MIFSTWVSASSSNLSSGNSKRRARIAICWSDSSPVMYKTLSFFPKLQRACSNKVDFPIPGSPPINTVEPTTNPPPRTRSSSSISVGRRVFVSVLTSASREIVSVVVAKYPEKRGLVLTTTSSTKLFHVPQSEQCPAHFGYWAPHFWHVYTNFVLSVIKK